MSATPEGEGKRGRFITLEGGEGAGKSMQVRILVAALTGSSVGEIIEARPGSRFKLPGAEEEEGRKVLFTREPGGTEGAEKIRDLLVSGASNRWDALTEALLLYAARRDHWYKLIEPALRRGIWVISDRFADSTMVYQGIAGDVPLETLAGLHRLALGETQPDLTFFLDIPVEVGLERTRDRNWAKMVETDRPVTVTDRPVAAERFEKKSLEFHQRVRDGFKELARFNPKRIVTIDADRPPHELALEMEDIVEERFPEDFAGD